MAPASAAVITACTASFSTASRYIDPTVKRLVRQQTLAFAHQLSQLERVVLEVEAADIELRVPAVQKAWELIGFEAKVDLDEGIRRTAEYYKTLIPSLAS